MMRIVRRFGIVRSEQGESGWLGKWLKEVLGGLGQKKSEQGQSADEEERTESGSGSSGDSSDGEGGLKIPIPDGPTRLFLKEKHYK
jgi:hypothetical protein